MRPLLILMAKEPVAGAVKTRLAKSVGAATAAATYRAMQSALIARLAGDPRWQTLLCVAPDRAVFGRMFPNAVARIGQGRGDLGTRMQRVFDYPGTGPRVIVGTDIPGMSPADIAAAFTALQSHDAVLGPAGDGGYWLIGLKRFPNILRPFADVRWSGPEARADTLANLGSARVALLRTIDDLDTADDLKRLSRFAGRRVPPPA